jgi:hypothetical protein
LPEPGLRHVPPDRRNPRLVRVAGQKRRDRRGQPQGDDHPEHRQHPRSPAQSHDHQVGHHFRHVGRQRRRCRPRFFRARFHASRGHRGHEERQEDGRRGGAT